MLGMHSIGEDHHPIGCKFGHQGLIHGDKRRLFDFPQSGLKPPTLVGKTFKRAPKALKTH